MNAQSSRSHAIFSLKVDLFDNSQVDNLVSSKLQLVDLAGSERTSMTGATGIAAKEAIDINKSLFTLRQVITTLAEGQGKKKTLSSHIPFRDSKLTSLLKQSLGGNSYSLMVACLSPCDAYSDENISTLNYAMKASFIANEPVQNIDPKIRLISELRQKVAGLEKQLMQANKHIEMLTDRSHGTMPATPNG
jgi:Kinesin motor domain